MIYVLKRKHIIYAVTLFLLGFALYFFCANGFVTSVFSNIKTNDWGLSYKTNGEKPVGNADSEFLRQYNAFYTAPTDEKRIYLTFDAGYENGATEQILDALKKHDVKATFFLVGNYIEKNPDIVKRMCNEGHIVANHTYSHPDMSKISSKEKFSDELTSLEELYKKTTGQEMLKFYRPPQGKFSEENLAMAKELGYKTFFWSLAYVDWIDKQQPTKDEAFSKLLTRIHPGAIVLLHSTSKTNGMILDELLQRWEELGYSFGSLTEIN